MRQVKTQIEIRRLQKEVENCKSLDDVKKYIAFLISELESHVGVFNEQKQEIEALKLQIKKLKSKSRE